jgi:transcriptional/translational regulatory protein YebC/TACO1
LLPNTYVKLQGSEAEQMVNMMNELEDHDDTKEVFNNADIPQDIMEKIG